MDIHKPLINNFTNALSIKSTPKSLLDLPEEIIILIGYRTAAISIKAWLNLVSTCRYLRRVFVGGQDFWRVLASSKLRLPYWWRGKPKPDCVYGHHKDWKSAYIAIRKKPLPFLDSVYVLKDQARELDPTLTHAWTFIKLFKNGTFVRSELKTKTSSLPKKLFDGAVIYGEWRMCENKLVLVWTHRYVSLSDFQIRDHGKEIAETGRASGYISCSGWDYFFENQNKFTFPLVYRAVGCPPGELASHETIAAMQLGKV